MDIFEDFSETEDFVPLIFTFLINYFFYFNKAMNPKIAKSQIQIVIMLGQMITPSKTQIFSLFQLLLEL